MTSAGHDAVERRNRFAGNGNHIARYDDRGSTPTSLSWNVRRQILMLANRRICCALGHLLRRRTILTTQFISPHYEVEPLLLVRALLLFRYIHVHTSYAYKYIAMSVQLE